VFITLAASSGKRRDVFEDSSFEAKAKAAKVRPGGVIEFEARPRGPGPHAVYMSKNI